MTKDIELVVLECDSAGVTAQKFEVSHAERLLGMQKNGGWRLPKDSDYQFNAKTKGITKKAKQAI